MYALLVCTYSLVFQIRTRSWPFTEGELAELGVETFGAESTLSDQDYASTALFQYEVDGSAFEGTKISPWIFVASHNARFVLQRQLGAVQWLSDDKVKVFYNPRKPKKSFLIVAGRLGIGITLLVAVLPLLAYYVRFYL